MSLVMRMLFVVIVLSGFVLASSLVDAEQRGTGPSWKVEGETLRVKNGNELTWILNLQDVQNQGRPKTNGFWFRLDDWDNLGRCFVGKEMHVGTTWKAKEDRANVIWRFSDESTLRSELIEETVCVVKRPAIGLDFGTWST